MKIKHKIGLGVLIVALLVAVTSWYLSRHTVDVLQPAGQIGTKERNLIIFCSLLSVTVVLPVFTLLFYFAWKYREGNAHRAKYRPDQDGNAVAETIWWLIPTVLLVVISITNWHSSYALDPFKPLASRRPTMHIQVVALDWKWLFIYPEQHVASVNEVVAPTGTPIDFEITSDAVMTSFWVPQLGGQMYAMPGMSTQLNLVADKNGTYQGVAANISGKGFADMKFAFKAVPSGDFNDWLTGVQQSNVDLTARGYEQLAKPGTSTVIHYASVPQDLYNNVVMKYMMPMNGSKAGVGVAY